MPKRFPFYNPASHQRIIALLEAKQPCAIVAATTQDAGMVGGISPFPLIEDGDFDIPSVYTDAAEGARLASYAGHMVALEIRAERRPSWGCNVIARKGGRSKHRVVICAHIDAKQETPGALDNASGTTVLLLLAELLAAYQGALTVEIVALNGEDHYANPGEQLYLASNDGWFDTIVLAVNLDSVGYREGAIAYSLYNCPAEVAGPVRSTFAERAGFVEGEPWYQGDHSLFLLHQRPALALTSERVFEIMSTIVHTPADLPELVDPDRLTQVAVALHDLLLKQGRRLSP
jgi:aminopeptidase YwaD